MSHAKHAIIKKASAFPQRFFIFINSGNIWRLFSRDTKHNQIKKKKFTEKHIHCELDWYFTDQFECRLLQFKVVIDFSVRDISLVCATLLKWCLQSQNTVRNWAASRTKLRGRWKTSGSLMMVLVFENASFYFLRTRGVPTLSGYTVTWLFYFPIFPVSVVSSVISL